MGKVPTVRVTSKMGILWSGYGDVSEMDEITRAILQKYGPIDIYLQLGFVSELTIRRYFINNVEVTLEEANTVWRCLQPRKNTLMQGDFIDLDKVEAILKRCKLNDAI